MTQRQRQTISTNVYEDQTGSKQTQTNKKVHTPEPTIRQKVRKTHVHSDQTNGQMQNSKHRSRATLRNSPGAHNDKVNGRNLDASSCKLLPSPFTQSIQSNKSVFVKPSQSDWFRIHTRLLNRRFRGRSTLINSTLEPCNEQGICPTFGRECTKYQSFSRSN